MLIVHVHVHVKPEAIEAFKQATLENARASVQEPGIARFDVIQDMQDPAHFILVDVYRDAESPASVMRCLFMFRWRDAVVNMMAAPRASEKFTNIYPPDSGW
jgi:quinol monooxygenase YgiN